MNMSETSNQVQERTIEIYNETIMGHLGIEILSWDKDSVEARMPVDKRTHQPAGLLHGGASVVLAETLASIGASLHIDGTKDQAVGLEINANHLKAVKSGWVYGKASPIHVGRRTHVWQIEIRNEAKQLVCTGRCTMAIVGVSSI